MQKITVTYENFDGENVTEDLYFHLNIKELQEMENWDPSLTERIAKLTKTEDGKDAFNLMRNIIETAYGERSSDGKRFLKSPEIRNMFTEGLAYDEVIIQFLDGTTDLGKFIEGLLPKKVFELAKKNSKNDVKEYLVKYDIDPKLADEAAAKITEGSTQE
nr:MAG TPA: hypothetical protein [Caudoviricetes sp.]